MIAQPTYFDKAARLDLRRYPAARDAYELLCELADASGTVTLSGGVRGWSEALGCSRGYPKALFALLEEMGYIDGIDYYPGEGGQVAEIHLRAPADRSLIESEPSPGHEAPHQDAVNDSLDRSLIESPQTPLYGTDHESKQQQQHGRAHAGVAVPDRAFLTAFLLREFPQADPALIAAWQADPRVDDLTMAHQALTGFPAATLTDWRTDLALAEKRDDVGRLVGFVLAIWSKGGRVTEDRRTSRPPPSLAERAQAKHRQAVVPSANRVADKRQLEPRRSDIEAAPDLSDVEREPWLRRFDAAAPDDRPDVLHQFWTWWGEREQARKLAPPTPPGAVKLNQVWQATLGALQAQFTRQEFDTWLRGAVLVALEDGTATVQASSALHQQGLAGRYQAPLRRALGDVVGYPVAVRVITRQAAAAAD